MPILRSYVLCKLSLMYYTGRYVHQFMEMLLFQISLSLFLLLIYLLPTSLLLLPFSFPDHYNSPLHQHYYLISSSVCYYCAIRLIFVPPISYLKFFLYVSLFSPHYVTVLSSQPSYFFIQSQHLFQNSCLLLMYLPPHWHVHREMAWWRLQLDGCT